MNARVDQLEMLLTELAAAVDLPKYGDTSDFHYPPHVWIAQGQYECGKHGMYFGICHSCGKDWEGYANAKNYDAIRFRNDAIDAVMPRVRAALAAEVAR